MAKVGSPHRLALSPIFLLIVCLLAPSPISGANGDLLRVSTALDGTRIVDITRDTSDGTFWVLGADAGSADAHRIYHLAPDLNARLGEFDNPHPPGSLATGDLTSNRGIAYRPLSRTLFVLSRVGAPAARQYVLREVARDGVENPAATVAITGVDAAADLFGLCFDPLTREFWTLDVAADRALRLGTSGAATASITLPGKTRPETVIRGHGIAHMVEVIDQVAIGRFYVPYGDIFRREPALVVQIGQPPAGDIGERTGVELPLEAVGGSELRGVEVFRVSTGRRVIIVSGSGSIFTLDHVVSDPLPPSVLACSLTVDNQVRLTWANNGTGENRTYSGEIQVLRNGVPFASVAGDTTYFLDETPIDGESTYSLRASAPGGVLGLRSSPCRIVVGTGGLVHWAQSPARSLGDVTRDPGSGLFYATDPAGGSIFVFDGDLHFVGEIASPWSDPLGIAFIPSVTLGFPPQELNDLLVVARERGNQARFVDLEGNVKTSISLAVPAGAEQTRIAALTYVPESQRLVAVEAVSDRLFAFTPTGSLISDCRPPELFLDVPLDHAVCFDPIQQTFLTGFKDGFARELFLGGGCPLSGFQFDLRSLGDGWNQPGFIGGYEIDGNTLVVSGTRTAALYRVLVFPFSPEFVRGDFDASGVVNVTDAVLAAGYLFLEEAEPPRCLDAIDANDDGSLDVADPVYLLFWLFMPASPPPPAPYPEPGLDLTFRDSIGCGG